MENNHQQYPRLRGDIRVDVGIVGGGLTGVCCAAMLSALGARVALAEAWQLGHGATQACTGVATSQLAGGYHTIAQGAGLSAASRYALLLREAVPGLRELCTRLHVPARQEDVYVFAETVDDLPALHALARLEARLGLPVFQAADAGGCPFPVALSLGMERQITVPPLPYLRALAAQAQAQGCHLYEHTAVRAIEGRRLVTDEGSIRASAIILATGVPAGCTSLPRLAALQQHQRQRVMLQGEPPVMNCHLSVHPEELSLCPGPGGVLLSWDMGPVYRCRQDRRRLLLRTLSALLPDMAAVDSLTRQEVYSGDGLPLIGPMHPGQSHLLMATGYGSHGLLGSYLAARVLTGYITGRPVAHAQLFRPDRPMPAVPGALRMASAYLGSLSRRSAPVCPHMGGRLRYDVENRRWVCPCHGSAFTTMGEMLSAPAMGNAEVSARQR